VKQQQLRKLTVIAFAMFVAFCAGFAISARSRRLRLDSGAKSITSGMTEAEVSKLIGPLDKVRACFPASPNCAHEFDYDEPLDPAGNYWAIYFDRHGRVISNFQWASP
jgi:hypothetical protein